MKEKMLDIAKRLEKRADAIMNNLWRRYDMESGDPPPKSSTAWALNIMAEEIRETLETVRVTEPMDIADVMTVEDFKKRCVVGAFIDSDGEGFYGNPKEQTSLPARPSRIAGDDIDERWSHVFWYNR